MAVNKFLLELLGFKQLTDSVREFIFTTASPLEFKAGQFISLHLEQDLKEVRRNYSITNAPQDSGNTLSIAVSYVPNGLASTLLWNLQVGQTVNASGPYGIFVLEPTPPPRYVLIGTGTGIAPYRSMLPDIASLLQDREQHVVVVQGVRTQDDLLYRVDFCALATKQANFKFMACYSRNKMQELQAYERTGYIQQHLAELKLIPGADQIYLCGNPAMVDDLFNLLQEQGFDKKAIKREKYVISR